MKRYIKTVGLGCLILVLLLTPVLTGCGNKPQQEEDAATAGETATPGPSTEQEAIPVDQLLLKGKGVSSFSFDSVITTPEEKTLTAKVWFKDGNMRSEMVIPGDSEMKPSVTIVNQKDKVVYMYDPQSKTAMKMPLDQSKAEVSSPSDYLSEMKPETLKYLGKETYDNKLCLVYETNVENLKGKIWIWEEYGLPLRIESYVEGKTTLIEYKNINIGNVDDSQFELPAGAKVTDIGDMFP